MSNSQVVSHTLSQLEEITLIIGSLKSIALLESQQAKSNVTSQRQGLETMCNAAETMMTAFPTLNRPAAEAPSVLLIFGSERGFCGDFNTRLLTRLQQLSDAGQLADCVLCPVGLRLANRLGNDHRIITTLSAPSVYAEIGSQLTALMDVVGDLSSRYSPAGIATLYHDGLSHQPCFSPMLGDLQHRSDHGSYANAPLLNLEPEHFLTHLLSEYVLTRLNHILTLSFYAENLARLAHLNGALDRVEKQTAALEKQRNHLRQELITQELETILLSSGLMDDETI